LFCSKVEVNQIPSTEKCSVIRELFVQTLCENECRFTQYLKISLGYELFCESIKMVVLLKEQKRIFFILKTIPLIQSFFGGLERGLTKIIKVFYQVTLYVRTRWVKYMLVPSN